MAKGLGSRCLQYYSPSETMLGTSKISLDVLYPTVIKTLSGFKHSYYEKGTKIAEFFLTG